MRHKHRVHAAQESHGEREAATQCLQAVFECRDTPAHFACVFYRDAGLLIDLVQQEIRKRGLHTLNLRGQHRFFADKAVEQEGGIGQMGRERIQPSKRDQCIVEPASQCRRPGNGRLGRQRRRHECLISLICRSDLQIGSR